MAQEGDHKGNKIYMEQNKNEVAGTVPTGKFIALNAYIRKEKRSQVNVSIPRN